MPDREELLGERQFAVPIHAEFRKLWGVFKDMGVCTQGPGDLK